MDFHFAGRQKIDARNGLVADGHLTLDCAHVESRETGEVFEEGLIRGAASELDLGKFGGVIPPTLMVGK